MDRLLPQNGGWSPSVPPFNVGFVILADLTQLDCTGPQWPVGAVDVELQATLPLRLPSSETPL
jgi:hypothetical protein